MKYLIANWKANPDLSAVEKFVADFPSALVDTDLTDKKVIVAAPAIFYTWLKKNPAVDFAVALEDISLFAGGAYTGEITPQNLRGQEPAYVIVGHSERRREFGETNETVVRKAQNAWDAGSVPIICFDTDEMEELSTLLTPWRDRQFIMAYEPVSSISTSGSGGNLDPDILREQQPRFRTLFPGVPVIYGGSVKPDNAGLYGAVCDGLLVGSASLQAESFAAIIRNF